MIKRPKIVNVKLTPKEDARLRAEASRTETPIAQIILKNLAHIIGENWLTAWNERPRQTEEEAKIMEEIVESIGGK